MAYNHDQHIILLYFADMFKARALYASTIKFIYGSNTTIKQALRENALKQSQDFVYDSCKFNSISNVRFLALKWEKIHLIWFAHCLI